ncbi:hypothetical protein ACOI9Y_34040, partial [Mesorhizobium japonicum]
MKTTMAGKQGGKGGKGGKGGDRGASLDPRAGRAPVVAALDLGQSKVSCFIMKPDGVRHADRTIRVAGASHVQSK